MSNPIFKISTTQVDFSRLVGSTPQTRVVHVVLGPTAAGSMKADPDQPWLKCQLANLQGRSLDLVLSVDPSCLPGKGTSKATVIVIMGGQIERIEVLAQSAASISPSPALIFGRLIPLRHLCSGSLVLTILAIAILGTIVQVMAASGSATQQNTNVVAGSIVGVYLLAAFLWAIPMSGMLVRSNSRAADHMRLNLALSEACTKLSVPKPWLVIRPGTTPNTRSFGILGKLAVLQIEQGLLDTVSGDRELAAVLAHEVAHLRRFDTLFFTVVGPLISLARLSLGLMMGGGMVLQRIGRSMAGAFSPATSLARMQRAGVVGIIVMFAVVMTIMMLAAYLMMFAFVAVLVVGGLAVGGLAWSRHAESAADACAANALGNPDGLLTALAWCVDQFPSQRADIERFMLSCGSSGNYGLADVIRCIKNGGSVVSSDSRLQRLLATHPTVLKRIAVLLVRCKTQIA